VATHICLTLIVKELKINVEHGKVVTTLNIMKHTDHTLCNYLIAELPRSFDGWGHEEPG
jgi:hypothetical protein